MMRWDVMDLVGAITYPLSRVAMDLEGAFASLLSRDVMAPGMVGKIAFL